MLTTEIISISIRLTTLISVVVEDERQMNNNLVTCHIVDQQIKKFLSALKCTF